MMYQLDFSVEKPQSNTLTEPYIYCRIICSKGMWKSKDGSYKKNVGSSSRKNEFRTEDNLSICLSPTEISHVSGQ